ncbi:MAG: PIG-L family deacetylase [Nanoarchaeota archaeon]
MKNKAVCIVAHPDDETIWMGGMILRNENWNWTIFSLCRGNDKDRAPKFKKVCDIYKAKSIITNLDDEILKPLKENEIKKLIQENLKEDYDYIFTHGKNGEYGHIRHMEIHQTIKSLSKENFFKKAKINYFSYKSGKEKAPHDKILSIPIADKKAEILIVLNQEEYQTKRKIIEETYGFKHPIFETLSCGKMEAFSPK